MPKFKHEDDIQGYCILGNEDLDAIHQSTLDLMGDYGLQIHGKDAHDILSAAGCDVDRETDRVRFPANLVNDAIESCPEEFTLCGRNPKNDTLIGKKRVAYKNFGNRGYDHRSIHRGRTRIHQRRFGKCGSIY